LEAEVFGDDVAAAVREAYLKRLANGEDGKQATTSLLEEFQDELADFDDGPILWLALAATQWEYGSLQEDVKARALAAVDDENARWTGPEKAKRKKALSALAKKLQSPPPVGLQKVGTPAA
jgi:hypothetical protein